MKGLKSSKRQGHIKQWWSVILLGLVAVFLTSFLFVSVSDLGTFPVDDNLAVLSSVENHKSSPDPAIVDSKERRKHQLALLNSLSYHVDGEWEYCGGENLESMTVLTGHRGKLLDISTTNSSSCPDHLDLVRFVPKRLISMTATSTVGSNSSTAYNNSTNNNTHTDNRPQEIWLEPDIKYHRFSSQESAQCLQNQSILLIGDSHTRNIWRGMLDVVSGNLMHDYHRWDGYQALTDFPANLNAEQATQLLPNSYYVHNNDHSKIGVPHTCQLIPKAERNPNITGGPHYWKCKGARQVAMYRREYDLRSMESTINEKYNISLHMSWCASSFRSGMDDSAGMRGPECRDAPGVIMREKDESHSYFGRLLLSSKQKYDLIVVGHHVHDVKRELCKHATDMDACRAQMGRDMLARTEQFAAFCAEHQLPLLWVTCGPMNSKLIPKQYHQFQRPDDFGREREQMAAIMQKHGFPVLDAFHMGESCRQHLHQNSPAWPACLSDGMHGSRYLDRMRAQMILNWKCRVDGRDTLELQ